ncbi:MAG: endonuclease/exonuclease/phosphatase family protein, partial [Burkholderiales bacterium]
MHALSRILERLLTRGLISIYSVLALGAVTNATAAELTLATWNIAWLRGAPLSDADYAKCRAMPQKQRDQLDERDPMRWICRSSEHYVALAQVAERINADIIALQEVESVDAIYRVFPRDRYMAFVTGSPWIQRTGFAVRKGRAEVVKFEDYAALGAPMPDYPRHGGDLTVRPPGGKVLRLLAVHLKSACHSRPLTDETMGRYDKPGNSPPCKILGDQVRPLEEWIDARAREGVDFLVMGDFNRRLDSAIERTEPARDPQGRQVTLWKEIDDGDPPGARLVRATAG